MPLGNRAKTAELSTVYDDAVYELGTTYVQLAAEVAEGTSGVDAASDFALLQGERTWIFIKAGSAISAGDLCKRNAAGTPFVAAPDAADDTFRPFLVGIADHNIASGSYGWIIAKGTAVCKSDTGGGGKAIAANALISSDGSTGSAGEVASYTLTPGSTSVAPVVGVALEAADATKADFVQAIIDLL